MFEIFLAVVAFLAGSAVTWHFSRRSSEELRAMHTDLQHAHADLQKRHDELRALVEKLPVEFRSAIAGDPRAELTARQVSSLADRVAAIHAKQEPRRITDDQGTRLASAIVGTEPGPILMIAAGNDNEAQSFRDEIARVFVKAGWPVSAQTGTGALDVSGLAVGYYVGEMAFRAANSELPPPSANVLAVASAFSESGIPADLFPIPEGRPANVAFQIIVGQKQTM